MLPQRGTSVSIVSFVRGIVKTRECGLVRVGEKKSGVGWVSHSEVVQDPAAGEGWAPPLPRVGMDSSTLVGRGWLWGTLICVAH